MGKNDAMKQARSAAGLSQQELADRLGVSRQTINAIEKGGLQLRHPPVHRHLPGAGADPE